ncbi:NAD(P)-binding Rossmann-fold containing protein [Venustampulla echinocandica]|uniref:NAD(P)-binding Rossmann-fold containing protein n=1 Tax=Venustampulla echinocandica TaxID=2656787 RepID=A0A370TI96_9HELO|nr:NAD(P)-binding Rossmann-fold containing protein [Venustampulla echinocandica]RDL35067.1 NAD(P)-binding Rossmann-fold containing protein [Venustampulla echinocandica]
MSSTTYLITGANRGLGRGLLEALIQRPNTTVIAGVRDPSNESSKSLESLKTASGSKVITVKIDYNSLSTVNEAIQELQSKHNITSLDFVIANAGISNCYATAEATPLDQIREHYEINAVATVALYQATIALLKKSPKPVFVGMSSAIASIGDMEKVPAITTAYGMSKAALNYLVRKIHFENPELVAFAISPGWVQTDMGTFGAKSHGMEDAPVTLEQSVEGMLKKFDGATREKTSGTFQSYDEATFAW